MENKFNPSEDSIVFSALYENYETYIKDDNPNKRLGMWLIEEERLKNLKYAYVYLTDCGGMLVKKYHILRFEKDINTPDKHHFYFQKGEDFFVQYPFGIVQGHHYVSSLKLDNLPRLENSEINQRVEKSKNTKMNKIRREKIIKINSREKLSKIYISKYLLQKQRIKLSDTNMLVKLVDEGQDPDTVLTNYFSNIKK
jgi:hypothetical protein